VRKKKRLKQTAKQYQRFPLKQSLRRRQKGPEKVHHEKNQRQSHMKINISARRHSGERGGSYLSLSRFIVHVKVEAAFSQL
jgi:hypothetical protein